MPTVPGIQIMGSECLPPPRGCLGIFGHGVPCGSPNPDRESDKICNFSVSIFRPRLQNPYLFSVLVCKIHIHIGLLDYTHFQANNNLKLTKMAQNHTPCNSHMDTYPYGCYKGFTPCTPSSPGWCTKNVELRENSSEEMLRRIPLNVRAITAKNIYQKTTHSTVTF